jgi:hypothetical protein
VFGLLKLGLLSQMCNVILPGLNAQAMMFFSEGATDEVVRV